MGLFSFLQGKSASDGERAATADPVQAARSRARRRLIGAAVLLGVGVIGFPLLFETQPRPIAVDIPIEIPRKDGAPSLPLPPPRTPSAAAARVSGGVVNNERSADAARSAASATTPRNEPTARSETPPTPQQPARSGTPPPARSETAPPARSETPPPSRSDSPTARAETPPAASTTPAKPAPKPETTAKAETAAKSEPAKSSTTKTGTKADDGARARALLEGQGAPAAAASSASKPTVVAAAEPAHPEAAGSGRFVVQVGSYGEAASARDMRQRVDKLGLKSYAQVVQVDGARRIRVRVGPFAGRDEAEKAAGTLKAAGMTAAVLTL
jgi:DedD protein